MAGKKVIAICRSGGTFKTLSDGLILSYDGGEAHAIDIDKDLKYNDFYMEVAEMFNQSSISMTYILPANKKTLITVSTDTDLRRMIKYHVGWTCIDVYVKMDEVVAPDVSQKPPASRKFEDKSFCSAGFTIQGTLTIPTKNRSTCSQAGDLFYGIPSVMDNDTDGEGR